MAKQLEECRHICICIKGEKDANKLYGSSVVVITLNDNPAEQTVKAILEKESSTQKLPLIISALGKAQIIVKKVCEELGMTYSSNSSDSGFSSLGAENSLSSIDSNRQYPAPETGKHETSRRNVAYSLERNYLPAPALSSSTLDGPSTKFDIEEAGQGNKERLLKASWLNPSGYLLGCFGDLKLTDYHFHGLSGTNCLPAEIVDGFCEVLKKKYRDVTCIRMSPSVDRACEEGYRIIQSGERMKKMILAPILTDEHGSLLIMRPGGCGEHLARLQKDNIPFVVQHLEAEPGSPRVSSLEFFDSLGGEEEKVKAVLPSVRRILRSGWEVISYKHPLQRDGYSCGVYILHYATCAVRGEYSKIGEPLTPTRLDELRLTIGMEILLNSDDVCLKCTMEFLRVEDKVICDTCERPFHKFCMEWYSEFYRCEVCKRF